MEADQIKMIKLIAWRPVIIVGSNNYRGIVPEKRKSLGKVSIEITNLDKRTHSVC